MDRGGRGAARVPRHLEVMRILVVEDERKVASFVRQGLAEEGYAVDVATDGTEALDLALGGHALRSVMLDVMLPKRDGFAVLRALREHRMAAPVLLLTARDSVGDRSRASTWARTTTSRSRSRSTSSWRVSVSSSTPGRAAGPVLHLADLRLDPATRQVTRGGREISLTAREYALLEYFLRNAGRVLTRPMLAEHVWGIDFDPESNVIDVYVGYLRRKIDLPGETRLLQTARGAGLRPAGRTVSPRSAWPPRAAALWYGGVLLVVLLLFSGLSYAALRWSLRATSTARSWSSPRS